LWQTLTLEEPSPRWILLGDFNMVTNKMDRVPPFDNAIMGVEKREWENLTITHGLHDISISYDFNYTNNRTSAERREAKLDRVLINDPSA